MTKKLVFFGAVYAAIDALGLLFVYGVDGLSRTADQSTWEEILSVMLTFPAIPFFPAGKSLYLYVGVNTIFWTLLWAIFLYLTRSFDEQSSE